jgi:hypothetical protein
LTQNLGGEDPQTKSNFSWSPGGLQVVRLPPIPGAGEEPSTSVPTFAPSYANNFFFLLPSPLKSRLLKPFFYFHHFQAFSRTNHVSSHFSSFHHSHHFQTYSDSNHVGSHIGSYLHPTTSKPTQEPTTSVPIFPLQPPRHRNPSKNQPHRFPLFVQLCPQPLLSQLKLLPRRG